MDTSEVLGTADRREGPCEVCASADARYDDEHGHLVVNLDSFLRTTDLRAKERRLTADWLPAKQSVTESVGPDEASEMARDIFHRWVHKVRQAMAQGHARVNQ
jgi:hypothetical protein